MTGTAICTCRFCGQDKKPQGIKSHETWCDENDNPGIAYDKQKELGILDESSEVEAESGDNPNPHQSVSESPNQLPNVETLSPDKSPSQPDKEALTDGGKPSECPCCEGSEVWEASEAKEWYKGEVDKPNGRAILAYELAEWNCKDPDCAALWGGDYDEALTMEAVMNA